MKGRDGDPLQLPEEEVRAPTRWTRDELRGLAWLLRNVDAIHVSRDPEEYFAIWNAGFDEAWSQRIPRLVWAAVIAATLALVLVAFQAGRIAAAPRSASDTGAPALIGAPSPAGLAIVPSDERPPSGVEGSGAPSPTGAIGEPASYCKPGHCETPAPRPRIVSHGTLPGGGITGSATWYDWHPGEAAAGPGLRDLLGPDWRGKTVTVISPGCTCKPIAVVLTDWCLCRDDRIIDLDAGSFAQLSDLRRGIIRVQVIEGDWTQ